MNAEEMFEKLGYKKVDLSSSGYIEYERLIDDKCFSFDLSEEFVLVLTTSRWKS